MKSVNNMIVVIDVSVNQKEFVYFLGSSQKKEAQSAVSLLSLIEETLQEKKLQPRDLDGMLVVVGNGRFSSTRSATIIANCFSYAEQIPVALCVEADLVNESVLREKLQQPTQKYIQASYYAEPNITSKKI